MTTKGKKKKEEVVVETPVNEQVVEKNDEAFMKKLDEVNDFMQAIFNDVFKNTPPITDSDIKLANALAVIRANEMEKDKGLQRGFYTAVSECREAVLKVVISVAWKNKLALTDTMLIMNYLMKDLSAVAVWEYDNAEAIDEMIEVFNKNLNSDGVGMKEVLDSIGEPTYNDTLNGVDDD